MTVLGNSVTFKEDWLAGFASAYRRSVRKVPGAYGIMRADGPTPGKVSVVIGGGCGHYPAFAGLVGPGLADAAVVGDVFTSPSAEQVYRTAKAVDGGAGVLFSYGNYAGDVMHFGLAARRLAADGVPTRTVLVTDDVASGPEDAPQTRRGVAGDFFVFKVAAAAADRGDDLAAVTAVADHANDRTRTFGVAFGGCTLPGQGSPLFTVDEGRMELGLGIHGEPGIRTVDRLDATELADVLVDTLLPTLPAGGDGRVAMLFNGLGRTKYEEMFVCYRRVHERLVAAGLTLYRPEVGEFVTSLDMAGLSLSLMVLDDELAELYDAPCSSPGYRRDSAPACTDEPVAETPAEAPAPEPVRDGVTTRLLAAALDAVTAHEAELGRLDAVAGDGDHGIGMVRGLRAAVDIAARVGQPGDSAAEVGATLLAAGTALADASGGASGALYGVLLTETGGQLQAAGDVAVDTALAADAIAAAQDAFVALGGARLGDKTLLDALDPFRIALADAADAGQDLRSAWCAAAAKATRAAADTSQLISTRGRAARLGERGRGHADPGAVSFGLITTAVGDALPAAATEEAS